MWLLLLLELLLQHLVHSHWRLKQLIFARRCYQLPLVALLTAQSEAHVRAHAVPLRAAPGMQSLWHPACTRKPYQGMVFRYDHLPGVQMPSGQISATAHASETLGLLL
jgi:hypothetical protein